MKTKFLLAFCLYENIARCSSVAKKFEMSKPSTTRLFETYNAFDVTFCLY